MPAGRRIGTAGVVRLQTQLTIRSSAEISQPMLVATVVRVDNSILVDEAEIQGQPAKRGSGDGLVWRRIFPIPNLLRPTVGETLYLLLDDDSKIEVVVTEAAGPAVHFRAQGLMPKRTAS